MGDVNIFLSLLAGSLVKAAMMMWAQGHPVRKRDWEKVGTVSELFVHPLKSGRGWSVTEAQVESIGLRYNGVLDRFYLLTNSEYRRLNIRMEPTMALIEASIHGDDVHFDAPGMNTLILPKHIKPTTENQFECTIKDKLHRGIDCGLEAGLWFSTYLKRENLKFIIPDKMLNEIRPFSNFYFINPQMVLCQSSVDDLNSRLENYETTVREFRPNVVITGPSAYSEDDWEEMQIGDIHYKMTEPCLRCLITTVKAETGVRNPTIEPLKTLRKYRMLPTHPAGPVLGRYCENTTTGEIRVGDPVYIIRRRQSTA